LNNSNLLKQKIVKIFDIFGINRGHERTIKAKKNIIASFLIKGINIAIGLILVPLTINYLNPTKYGIWITLSSIIAWFGFFDIGLGHGLRNRFAEAIASGKHELARVYVSTTYFILSAVIIGVLIIFFAINPILNWNNILNTGGSPKLQSELSLLAVIVFTFFSIGFIFKLIATILTADQKPAKAALFDLLGKFLALIVIIVLTKTTEGSLLYLGFAASVSPVLVLIISSFWFFNSEYKNYKPSYKFVDFSKTSDLLNLGIKFFIIRIAAILLYQTNNIIISHLFGPSEVTPYSIAYQYFNMLMMGFMIVVTPFWSAFTEAWIKKDYLWIKSTMKKLVKFWGVLFVLAFIMLVCSKWVYFIWIGDSVQISFTISTLIALWILFTIWNGTFSHFLNGIGKIKLQLIIGITTAILNIPFAIILGRQLGIEGVLLANVILAFIATWIYPLQYYKLINHSAVGIWNK